jgi:hypothetical protein
MTIAGYKKAIAKLLKTYHKKWDWAGKPITEKKKKRSKKTNRKRNKISRIC